MARWGVNHYRCGAVVLALALPAAGATRGWNHTNLTQGAAYTNTVMLDYYGALAERYYAAGGATNGAITNVEQSIVLCDGFTNGEPAWVTNRIAGTNCFRPYVHVGGVDGVTRTAMPFVVWETWDAMDDIAEGLADDYLCYWAGGTNFEAWFATNAATRDGQVCKPGNATNSAWNKMPIGNLAAFYTHAGIGFVTNATTNYGIIDGGTAHWTYSPPVTQVWTLAEEYYLKSPALGTNWVFDVNQPDLSLRYFQTNLLPVLSTSRRLQARLPTSQTRRQSGARCLTRRTLPGRPL